MRRWTAVAVVCSGCADVLPDDTPYVTGPRVLAVALEDRHGALGALQERVVERLAAAGRHDPEARPYLPHVTVARVRSGTRPGDALAAPPPLAFDGAAVTLYRSRLQPSGARYEPLSVSRLA